MQFKTLAGRTLCGLLLALATSAQALDVQGHRGAGGLLPENTLPAFERALALGATTLELDIAITKDDVLVISHDSRLNKSITRGPDGKFLDAPGPPIRHLTWAQLQQYDVGRAKPGSAYASRYPQRHALDGTRIPRLSDLFELVKKSGHPQAQQVRFAIETKVTPSDSPDAVVAAEPFARAVIAAIREAGMSARSSVISFDWRTLAVVQKEAPEIATVYLTAQTPGWDTIGAGKPEGSPWTAGVHYKDHGSVPKMILAAGGRTWSAFHRNLDGANIREAHGLGLQVLAWTVNSPDEIEAVLDLGVDGIVSDRPDLVLEEVRRREGLWYALQSNPSVLGLLAALALSGAMVFAWTRSNRRIVLPRPAAVRESLSKLSQFSSTHAAPLTTY